MIQHIKKSVLTFLFIVSIPATLAYAGTPIVSLTSQGDGNQVNVSVTGADINSSAILFYTSSITQGLQSQPIGTTNNSGSFTGTVSTSIYNIAPSSSVYIVVNGYQSATTIWPVTTPSQSSSTNVTFSKSNQSVTQGQTVTTSISGSSGNYYIASNSNTSAVTATLSGNTLSLHGLAVGTSLINICSSNVVCSNDTVTVTNQIIQQQTAPFTISIPITTNQTVSFPVTGYIGPFTVMSSYQNIVNALITNNMLTVHALSAGNSVVTVCSNSATCSTLSFTVTTQTSITPQTQVQQPQQKKSARHVFTIALSTGMEGQEVLELQKRLMLEGYFSGTPNGYYGQGTTKAVKAYQKDHHLKALGDIGPGTRSELNLQD